MDTIANFFQHNIVVVYFFYGLAFFCMGLIVLLESRRASALRLSSALGFLAAFGIIHGLHEWFEMFQQLGSTGATAIPNWLLLDELRIGHLVISFILLLLFGIRLIFVTRHTYTNERKIAYISTGAFVTIWLFSVLITRWRYQPDPDEFLTSVDVLSRYMLGIPGALLAAWAIFLEQRTFRDRDLNETGRDLLRAALALFIYGLVGQIFTAPSFIFPATVINSDLFVQLFGIPVQLFRAVMAMLTAVFVIRALRAFETERQRNLARANEERLAAQRQALTLQEETRLEMETLNEELQTAVRELTLLFNLSRTLAATLNRKQLLSQAINEITAHLPRFARGIIVMRQKPGQSLECAACTGHLDCQTTSPCQQAQSITRHIEETGQPVCLTHNQLIPLPAQTEPGEQTLLTVSPDSAIGLPLSLQDRVIGSLVLHIHPDVSDITQNDLSLLSTITSQLSIAIENTTRYEESQAREALRGEMLHQVVSAQEQERQRIARELHDTIGQALTALGLGFAAVNNTVTSDPQLAEAQLVELKQMSTQALTELRDLIRDLRPSLLDDLGLVPALQNQVQLFQTQSDCLAELQVHGRVCRLSPDIETTIFRIAQEGLTNIAKHAEAASAQLTLEFTADAIYLQIQDDGRGFDLNQDERMGNNSQPRHAWGLLGMQERASLVGGSCQIESTPGQGTAVEVHIPLGQTNDTIDESASSGQRSQPVAFIGHNMHR